MQPKPRETARYTYADYLRWPDDERWELIDGGAYAMTPAPTPNHQTIEAELIRHSPTSRSCATTRRSIGAAAAAHRTG